MEVAIKQNILDLLNKGNHLSFKINLEIQGGPLVYIFLNDKGIGQIYTDDYAEKQYKNILKGSSSELELANSLEEWVQNDFFEFITSDEQCILGDPIEGLFFIQEKEILLKITMHEIDDFGERNYESYKYSLSVIEDYINNN